MHCCRALVSIVIAVIGLAVFGGSCFVLNYVTVYDDQVNGSIAQVANFGEQLNMPDGLNYTCKNLRCGLFQSTVSNMYCVFINEYRANLIPGLAVHAYHQPNMAGGFPICSLFEHSLAGPLVGGIFGLFVGAGIVYLAYCCWECRPKRSTVSEKRLYGVGAAEYGSVV